MPSIQSLIELIRRNKERVRGEICQNKGENLTLLLNTAHDYVLAPDLNRNTWNSLQEEDKECFYLFILMNEVNHYNKQSKIFLTNASMYLPRLTSVNARLKLFAKLSTMSHVQNQFERFSQEYLVYANAICNMDDPYIDKDSIKQLLLNYFFTFIQTTKESLSSLGQLALLEKALPGFIDCFKNNSFAKNATVELIMIAKGSSERPKVTINFFPPFLNKKAS